MAPKLMAPKRKKKSPRERGYMTRAEMVEVLRAWAESIERKDGKVWGSVSANWFKCNATFYYDSAPEDV